MKKRTHKTKRGHRAAEPAKGFAIPGGRLSHGQLFTMEGKQMASDANGQRTAMARAMRAPMTGEDMARSASAPNNLHTPEIVKGQRRKTSGEPAAFHHGVSVDDTPNVPFKSHERPVKIHDGMTDKQRATVDPIGNNPGVILRDAENFGRKT
jgi:hypothetical protein